MKRAAQFSEDCLTVTLTLERVEDVGPAIDFLTDMAGAVWRELVIEDDRIKSYVEANWRSKNGAPAAEAAHANKRTTKRQFCSPLDWSKPPKPGSVLERVLEVCMAQKRADYLQVAKQLTLSNAEAAASVAKLRKGGHFREFEAC